MSVTNADFNPSNKTIIYKIKTAANRMAAIIEALPPGRRRSVALTYLETSCMWAVKAAAIGDND